MRRKSWLAVAVVFIVTAIALTGLSPGAAIGAAPTTNGMDLYRPPRHSPASPAFAPGRVLVRFADSPEIARQTAITHYGLAVVDHIERLDVFVLGVEPGAELSTVARLSADPRVLYAEPDYLLYASVTPNDTYYADYQWHLSHIRADTGWDTTTGSSSVTIAIIDTGVDLTHPDLSSKIVSGYDYVNNDADPSDDEGHGTHVASIAAAASNNSEGIAGLSWGAKIMPLKVLDSSGSGTLSNVAQGIQWAADHGAQIINLSLGGSSSSSTLQDAVTYAYNAGALLVAAAGNEYESGNPTSYPAAYDHVLAVAATTDTDGHASYSNSGSYVDVAAPGGDPSSSYDSTPEHWIIGAYWRGSGYSYAWLAGTSQAAPQVAGLAALVLSVNGTLTNDQIESVIRSTAVDVGGAGWDEFMGDGRIDVAAAVAKAVVNPTSTPTGTPTTPPTATFTPTATRTNTPPPGATQTPTHTPLPTATQTNTPPPGATSTSTSTAQPSATPTSTATSGVVSTPTPTRTPRATGDQRVNDDPGSAGQAAAAIALDRLGNSIAVWKDWRNGPNALYSAGYLAFFAKWSPNSVLPGTQMPRPLGDPAVAFGGKGEVVVVWHDDHSGDFDIYVSRGAPGRTWTAPVQVNDDATTPAQQRNPDVAVGPTGIVYAVWEDSRAGTADIFWSRFVPGSGGWRPAARVHSDGVGDQLQPALAVDAAGNVYTTWVDRRPGQGKVVVAHLPAGSTTWNAPVEVGGGFAAAANPLAPDIAVDRLAAPHVVWEEQREVARGADIYHSVRRADGSWTAATRVNGDTGHTAQHTPRIAESPQFMAAVWEDLRGGNPDIFVAWLPVGSLDWGAERRVNNDTGSAVQTQPDVALDVNGNAYVVWTDERNGGGDVYFRFLPGIGRFSVYLPIVLRAP